MKSALREPEKFDQLYGMAEDNQAINLVVWRKITQQAKQYQMVSCQDEKTLAQGQWYYDSGKWDHYESGYQHNDPDGKAQEMNAPRDAEHNLFYENLLKLTDGPIMTDELKAKECALLFISEWKLSHDWKSTYFNLKLMRQSSFFTQVCQNQSRNIQSC
jgi:hypothetical protein